MKRVFNFKKGQLWDEYADTEVFNYFEKNLTTKGKKDSYPIVKKDLKVTVIIEEVPLSTMKEDWFLCDEFLYDYLQMNGHSLTEDEWKRIGAWTKKREEELRLSVNKRKRG